MKNKTKGKEKWLQKFLASAMFLLMGASCGIIISLYAFNPDTGKTGSERYADFALLFIGMYVAMFVQTVIHEVGHFVFGLISGYGYSSFRIFSLTMIKVDGKFKFRRMKVPGTLGQCLMTPPNLVDGKIPVVLYNLGGSIMNLISAIIFIGLYFVFSGFLQH